MSVRGRRDGLLDVPQDDLHTASRLSLTPCLALLLSCCCWSCSGWSSPGERRLLVDVLWSLTHTNSIVCVFECLTQPVRRHVKLAVTSSSRLVTSLKLVTSHLLGRRAWNYRRWASIVAWAVTSLRFPGQSFSSTHRLLSSHLVSIQASTQGLTWYPGWIFSILMTDGFDIKCMGSKSVLNGLLERSKYILYDCKLLFKLPYFSLWAKKVFKLSFSVDREEQFIFSVAVKGHFVLKVKKKPRQFIFLFRFFLLLIIVK